MTERADRGQNRDVWDKLDIIVRLITGGLLALLALLVKLGADRISTSLQTGQLVQSLVGDLSSHEEQVRQDIALIALNRSVGNDRTDMVCEIAERISLSVGGPDSARADRYGGIARQILLERCPERAAAVQDSLASELMRLTERAGIIPQQVSEAARLRARGLRHMIYIQFSSEQNRTLMDSLRIALAAWGYRLAGGVEWVSGDWRPGIRYFFVEDRQLADSVAAAVETFLERVGRPGQRPTLVDLSDGEFTAREGQIEVWLKLSAVRP